VKRSFGSSQTFRDFCCRAGWANDLTPRQLLDRHVHVLIVDTGEFNRLAASIANGSGGQLTACKTILLGMECDEEQFIAAVRSGVSGFLLQDASSSDVISAVRAVFRGEAICLHSFAPRYFDLWLKEPKTCLSQTQLQSPLLPYASSNW